MLTVHFFLNINNILFLYVGLSELRILFCTFYNYLLIVYGSTEKCSKPNEFYSCGGACDNECKTLGKQNRTSCPIVNITCNKKCYCEDGYARDAKGNCIPVDQCSKCYSAFRFYHYYLSCANEQHRYHLIKMIFVALSINSR
jgi:hypothetical protein